MKTLSFNEVPRRLREDSLHTFVVYAVNRFFDFHSFEPDTMYVSKRIYAILTEIAKRYLGPFERMGKDPRLVFRGLHIVNTGEEVQSYDEVEIELSDIGEDLATLVKTRVRAKRLVKGRMYTREDRLDFPTKVFVFQGVIPAVPEPFLSFDEHALIEGDKVVTCLGVAGFPVEHKDEFYEVSHLDRIKL